MGMTREEAIEWFRSSAFYHKDHEPFNMAIKALEQEPCKDAISRQAVLDEIQSAYDSEPLTDETNGVDYINKEMIEDFVESLPPVTPQPKTEILDKIRAEIMQLDYDLDFIDYDYNDMAQTEEVHTICREEVLQIIDKYKTEGEVEDANSN